MWTLEKLEILMSYREAGEEFGKIGLRVGMSYQQCRDKYRKIKHLSFEQVRQVENRKQNVRVTWRESEDAMLLQCFHMGMTLPQMAKELGRSEPACDQRLRQKHKIAPASLVSRRVKPEEQPRVNNAPLANIDHVTRQRMAMQRANVLHLLDLKRAGHSPARTEYRIQPDAGAPRLVNLSRFEGSLVGSVAAMCAE